MREGARAQGMDDAGKLVSIAIPAHNGVDRKAFWQVGGFNVALNAFEDNDLACRLARLKSLGHIHYDPRLVAYTSARRYNRYGFYGAIAYYARGYLKAFILKKAMDEFQDVRASS